MKKTKTTEAELLAVGVAEAARLSGLSRRSIHGFIAVKALRSRKVGKRRLIPIDALKTFLHRDHLAPAATKRNTAQTAVEVGA